MDDLLFSFLGNLFWAVIHFGVTAQVFWGKLGYISNVLCSISAVKVITVLDFIMILLLYIMSSFMYIYM